MKITPRILLCGSASIAFVSVVACGPSTSSEATSDYAARYEAAAATYAVNCQYRSTGAAKADAYEGALTIAELARLPGVDPRIVADAVAAAELAATTCNANGTNVATKAYPGTLAGGSACFSSLQCASNQCSGGKAGEDGLRCGVCAAGPAAQVGEACSESAPLVRCAQGARCDSASKKCVDGTKISGLGEDCGSSRRCVSGATCNGSGTAYTCEAKATLGSSCATTGACVQGALCANDTKLCVAVPKLGEACVAGSSQCAGGARCDAASSKCVESVALPASAACRQGESYCVEGASCLRTVATSSDGTCVVLQKAGEPCDSEKRFCGRWLTCSTTSKTCIDILSNLTCPLK